MTPASLAELRAKAEAATPGPWESEIDCFDEDEGIVASVSNKATTILFTSGTGVALYQNGDGPWTEEDHRLRDARWRLARDSQAMRDAAFIAAASPVVVIALLDQIAAQANDSNLLRCDLALNIGRVEGLTEQGQRNIAEIHRLDLALAEARAEGDRMRPIVDAAKRWRACDEDPNQLGNCRHDDLADAVDAALAAEAKEAK